MKNRIGWSLATLAILSFSFGQAAATAATISPTPGAALASTAPPPTLTPTATAAATATTSATATALTPSAGAKLPTTATTTTKAPAKAFVAKAPTSATDPTKVPHYFGPFPNYAWSPQVVSDAIVTITSSNGVGTGAEATATVDPKTGGVTAYTVTKPGTGYTAVPNVTIASPGSAPPAAGAVAAAVVSAGVVTSIAVDQAGFGFTTPSVAITNGGTIVTQATAQASGGVDNITITTGGSGYITQPTVTFGLPDAPYCNPVPAPVVPLCVAPTATATMTGGIIDSVTVVTGGNGYLTAPTVTILDAGVINPTAATVAATVNIGRIDITNGGAGYDSAPTVTITDSVVPFDKGASATATVAAIGAVSAVNVVTAGTGYLTPGLKKFVDTLSGLGPKAANNLGNYIPVAVPDTTTYPGTDYYEIAVVQYRQKFASSLPATLQRGYVQLSTAVTAALPGALVPTPLTNASLDPGAGFTAASTTWATTPAMLPPVGSAPAVQALGVDKPYSLGPTIIANKNRPVRVLFRNLLPTGVAGDLFLPVDTSLMGSGMGPKGMMLDPVTKVPMDMVPDLGVVTDGVRNPACGETPKPVTCYTENRATLHLHGGVTPWISDGTPHQWTTPAGQVTDYPEGVSVSNVPDMADPGPGAETFFYTNQQSARLMFYHDHAWGITRLNVYAGEAAGYLVTDATEAKLTAAGGALDGMGLGTPLIVQDKTFVSKNIAATDPTWDAAKWGGEGSLWSPHVYMPAQNPGAASGMSQFGRWMYGPWFWPPAKDAKYPPIANPYYDSTCDPNVILPSGAQQFCEPPQIPSTPNNSVGMEAFQDTPVVNGTAYPTTKVDPKAYRYRILNAANDRFWNLQWYVADPTTGTLSEVALKPAEVAAAQTDPNIVPTPDLTKSPVGPSWIQIGTEGGFLPAPTVVKNQPITWITDPTRFDFGNVDKHSLLVAPAERADVIVDFSQYAGKTLILYNDAPAAFPARQANEDFYTGGPDMSPNGASPTLPGYGPNTRTIMQVKVAATQPAVAFDVPNTTADRMGALVAALAHHADGSGVFESGSDPVIVGQASYNSAYGSTFVATGYCNSVTLPSARCDGFARIQEQGGDTFKFDTLGTNKLGAGTQLGVKLEPKGIHDEANSANFDEWGRMSANMGLEAPGATPLLQNIILYPYVNPATETLDATSPDLPSALNVTPISSAADGTQIWKITHNGVDTHPLHFHLYNVQVINRVTWDNIIIPPDANELGWKDTVRVSPLEDTYVAVRPIVPTIPFGVPDSKRLLNPAMPEGAVGDVNKLNGTQAGFNNTDANGNPVAAIANTVANFGWEYVWHCHMLSHEEMDMMRPVTVKVNEALPAAPDPLTTAGAGVLNWTDGTPVDYTTPTTWTNPGTAEIGYRVERALVTNGAPGDYAVVGKQLANLVTYTDATMAAGESYMFQVVAFNAAGDSRSAPLLVLGPPKAPTNLTAVVQPAPTLASGSQVSVSWVNNAPTATSVVVERAVGAGAFSVVATLGATVTNWVDTAVSPGPYSYQVRVFAPSGPSAYAGPVTVTVPQPASTTVVAGLPNPSNVGQSVTFTATVSGAAASTPTGTVIFTINGGATTVPINGGVATVSTALLPAGNNTITAAYSGDALFTASTGSVIQVVQKWLTATVVAGVPNPSLVGQPVTFTATVGPLAGAGTPTGSVTFTAGGLSTLVPLGGFSPGVASFTTAALPAGANIVTAAYSGDSTFVLSTGTMTQTVNTNATTTTLVSSLNPSLNGVAVTFTATVSPGTAAGVPTGTVNFTAGGVVTPVTVNALGVATFTTATLPVGANTITADYGGDTVFTASTASLTQTVNKNASTIVVVSNVNPSVSGGLVTFTATVTPASATGSVQFVIDGANASAPVLLVGQQATYQTAVLASGAHPVSAVYSGDGLLLTSTSPTITQTVGPVLRATTTAVTSNRLPSSNFRQNVTFTATVAPAAGAGIPTGTVQFNIDGINAGGLVTLNAAGRATFSTAALTAGSHTVIATYGGSAVFAGGSSTAFIQIVGQLASTIVVTSNRNPAVTGQSVTFTARVTPLLAGGTVQFTLDGAAVGGLVTLDATGRATLVTNTLAVGSHTLSAAYGGNVNYLPSTSATFTQTVNRAASRSRVTTSGTPSTRGTPVVFTATVTAVAPATGIPTGTVQFRIDGINVGGASALNTSGQASFAISTLAVGRHTVSFVYAGDAAFTGGSSANITQRVR